MPRREGPAPEKRNPYENAQVESFLETLKTEEVYLICTISK